MRAAVRIPALLFALLACVGASGARAQPAADAPARAAREALVVVGDGARAPFGTLVSRDGLVWTTRDALAPCALSLRPDLDDAGFVARALDEELPCGGLRVHMTAEPGAAARSHDDVRVVFVPERALADFGGPAARVSYPRAGVDAVLVRVWDGGRPLRTTRFAALSARGVVDGDRVWAAGQVESPFEAVSPAQLAAERDALLPLTIARLGAWVDVLSPLAARPDAAGPPARQALRDAALRLADAEGRLAILRDPVRVAEADRRHADVLVALHDARGKSLADADADAAERALGALDGAWRKAPAVLVPLMALEDLGPGGALWELAGALLDPAASLDDIDARAAALSLDFEAARLAWGLDSVRATLPARDATREALLRGRTGAARADELIRGTGLLDASRRAALVAAARAHRADPKQPAPRDPLLDAVALVRARTEALRAEALREVFLVEESARGPLGLLRVTTRGARALQGGPDAPVGLGVVRGATRDGKHVHWSVTVGELVAQDRRARGAADRSLPARWRSALTRLDFSMPLVFSLALDAQRPRAGGPLVNAQGLTVGLLVGTNEAALADDLVVPRGDGRAVATSSNGLLHALDRVYEAKHLVDELLSSAADR